LIVVAQLESSGVMPRIERAVELLVLVSQHPAARHATRARAARFLDAMIVTAPSEVAQAALARGQALELWATARELLAELSVAWEAGAAELRATRNPTHANERAS
jgi:hypothetical protein